MTIPKNKEKSKILCIGQEMAIIRIEAEKYRHPTPVIAVKFFMPLPLKKNTVKNNRI